MAAGRDHVVHVVRHADGALKQRGGVLQLFLALHQLLPVYSHLRDQQFDDTVDKKILKKITFSSNCYKSHDENPDTIHKSK